MFVYIFIKSYKTLIDVFLLNSRASQMALVVKNPPASAGIIRDAGLIPGWENLRPPRGGNGNPTPVFLPGKSPGQRSLVGYSSRGLKESDTTEHVCT